MLQVPQVCRFLDPTGLLFSFLDDFLKFPLQSSVEGCASDSFFRSRPGRFVLVGITLLTRGWAAHVPILHRGILSLSRVPFLQLRWLRSPGHIPDVSPAAAHPF